MLADNAEAAPDRPATLTDLPVELVLAIVHAKPDRHVWCMLALTCKPMVNIVTPLIYGDIKFCSEDLSRAIQCCKTLAVAPHLAQLVHTFDTFSMAYYGKEFHENVQALQAAFTQCLGGLSSLRHLHYRECLCVGIESFQALSQVSATLQTLSIRFEALQSAFPKADANSILKHLRSLNLKFPQLTDLRLTNYSLPSFESFLQSLAWRSSATIGTLTIYDGVRRKLSPPLFPRNLTWPSLETLQMPLSAIRSVPPSMTQTIRSLCVDGSAVFPPESTAPPMKAELFPQLQSLQCHPTVLNRFLPQQTNTGSSRPISSVEFTHDVRHDFILEVLPTVRHSAATLTTLTIRVLLLSFRTFDMSSVSASLSGLQRLTIVVRYLKDADDAGNLTDRLFAHTPHLVSFSLVDRSPKSMQRDERYTKRQEQQHQLVREWEKICPNLEYIAITGWFQLEKTRKVSARVLPSES